MNAIEQLKAAPPEVRAVALALLDQASRPMTVRELDHAFAREGFTRKERRPMIRALKHFAIIALGPR